MEHHVAEVMHFDRAFWYSVINFLALVLVLYIMLRKSVTDFFRKRSTTTRLEMEKSRKFYEESRTRYQEMTSKLDQASIEGKKLLDSIKRDGESEKQQMLESAKAFASKIKEDSEKIVQQELKRAQEALRAETANLAAELATKQIRDSITAADQTHLTNEFITEMQR